MDTLPAKSTCMLQHCLLVCGYKYHSVCNAVQVEVNRPRADAAEAAGLRLEVAELLQQVQSQAGLISQATAAKIQAEVSQPWPAWKLHCFA